MVVYAPAQIISAPAQLISAPAQLITAPAQLPATGAVVYTALFIYSSLKIPSNMFRSKFTLFDLFFITSLRLAIIMIRRI